MLSYQKYQASLSQYLTQKKSVDMHVVLFYMICFNFLVELGCHNKCF